MIPFYWNRYCRKGGQSYHLGEWHLWFDVVNWWVVIWRRFNANQCNSTNTIVFWMWFRFVHVNRTTYEEAISILNGIGKKTISKNNSDMESSSWFRSDVFQLQFTIGKGKEFVSRWSGISMWTNSLHRIDFSRFNEYITPVVSADAGTKPNESTVHGDTSDDESLSEDQQVKKKPKREKVGFRDRKVNARNRWTIATHDFFIYMFSFYSSRWFCCYFWFF